MKYEIKHRLTGAVLFTAEIGCAEDAGISVKLGLAVRAAVKTGAGLGGADLRGAYLVGADLRGAYLMGADLMGAYLGGADLRGAYLGGADLWGAYLGGAYLDGADLIDAGQDSRGYRFVGQMKGGVLMVHAGCRYLTMDEASEHWGDDYEGSGDRLEIQAKLTLITITAHSRGWLDEAKQAAE